MTTRIAKSGILCALVAIGAAIIAPTAAAVDTSVDTSDTNKVTACSFYAKETPYIDTGVGYAKNREAAEEYECPVQPADDD